MFLANMLGFLLKDEKGKTITIAFQTMIKYGHCKSNKLWEEKVGIFRTDQLHHLYKTLTLEFLQYIMNENH